MGGQIALLDGPGRVIGRTMGARGMAIAGGVEVTRNQLPSGSLGMPRDPLIS